MSAVASRKTRSLSWISTTLCWISTRERDFKSVFISYGGRKKPKTTQCNRRTWRSHSPTLPPSIMLVTVRMEQSVVDNDGLIKNAALVCVLVARGAVRWFLCCKENKAWRLEDVTYCTSGRLISSASLSDRLLHFFPPHHHPSLSPLYLSSSFFTSAFVPATCPLPPGLTASFIPVHLFTLWGSITVTVDSTVGALTASLVH